MAEGRQAYGVLLNFLVPCIGFAIALLTWLDARNRRYNAKKEQPLQIRIYGPVMIGRIVYQARIDEKGPSEHTKD